MIRKCECFQNAFIKIKIKLLRVVNATIYKEDR